MIWPEYLRLYESHEASETLIVPIRFCLEPSDLEELLQEADTLGVQVVQVVPAGSPQAAPLGGLANDLGAKPGPNDVEADGLSGCHADADNIPLR